VHICAYFSAFLAKKRAYTGVPELAPQRKQACADNKRDSKLTKINFLLAQITELHIKFLISPIPEARPQVLLKNPIGC
jgi:hypothetical protein